MDARFKHPITGIIAGPSGGGKTTFICKLLDYQEIYFDIKFKYIVFYIGTTIYENPIVQQFIEENSHAYVIEINQKYKDKEFETNFKKDFLKDCKDRGEDGCIVFDDMMQELSNCGILSNLFTKYSSHYKLSIFHITQNLFFKSKKDPNEHVTLYRNTHMLVLFKNPLDSSVASLVARRLASGKKYTLVLNMINKVLDKYRYIIINGGFKRDSAIQYVTDIFNESPTLHMKVMTLVEEDQDSE